MNISVFTEKRAELLCCPEAKQMVLYLHNPEKCPLPVEASQFVASLSGESRRWGDFVIGNYKDPEFAVVAEALQQATLNAGIGEVDS